MDVETLKDELGMDTHQVPRSLSCAILLRSRPYFLLETVARYHFTTVESALFLTCCRCALECNRLTHLLLPLCLETVSR